MRANTIISDMPPVMILCGGKGTRLRDVTELLPKPLVPIGEYPIVWHVMKSYAAFGVKRFILCLGYKREEFVDYFLNYRSRVNDITVHLGNHGSIEIHANDHHEDWQVTLANTGLETMTGGRILRAGKYLQPQDEDFFLTYGDGVADLNVAEELDFHRRHQKLLTCTAVHPAARFGELQLADDQVLRFEEKPAQVDGYINGGFMVLKKVFLQKYLLENNDQFFEMEPMRKAVHDGQMIAFRHEGFWQCMDNPREYQLLNELWQKGQAPWTKYW